MNNSFMHVVVLLETLMLPPHLSKQCLQMDTITTQKATVHQLTTMLSTSKNVLFPGHNHLLTTGAGNLIL